MHWNLLDDEEFGWLKFLKLKYRRGEQIIQPFCRIGSPQEIKSPFFNLRKFEKTEKSNAESCRMHWNLLDDEELGSLKFLKLKYRRGDQIIQQFCRIGSPQEIRSPIFNLRKFENIEKSWLYVFIMSRTRFRVNPHSIVAWMSRNSLLEAGAKSEGEVTATGF